MFTDCYVTCVILKRGGIYVFLLWEANMFSCVNLNTRRWGRTKLFKRYIIWNLAKRRKKTS